ncbi:hypothetical protein MMC06_003774 [Schaereria dolodes]|nr:hypothetical protein [Schaereria dolodes]
MTVLFKVLEFSPSKPRSSSGVVAPQRSIQPSPEKKSLPYTVVSLTSKRSAPLSESGSLVKKLEPEDGEEQRPDGQVNVEVGHVNQNLEMSLAQSKIVELPYSLIEAGRATLPPRGDFSDLSKLYPTTFAIDIFPPYLVFRVQAIPPKPWPLTIGGLPVQFCTQILVDPFDSRGRLGRGQQLLQDLNSQTRSDINQDLLRQVARVFQGLQINIRDIFWFGGFWQITIPDDIDIKLVPFRIASHPAYYRTISEAPELAPAALRNKPPQGVEYDDTIYATAPTALLRPGIMLSSSVRTIINNGESEDVFKTTTSGILVANQKGQLFITVATHGFEDDGLVYHPKPHNGTVIGRIVESLSGTDISIAKLNPGLRYVNETFGTHAEPNGVRMNGISAACSPHLCVYDPLTMNNPFSGSCEGVTVSYGIIIPDLESEKYVAHEWIFFENGNEPVDQSCGSPVLDAEGQVVGLFRYKAANSSLCLAVSAITLREYGYEICSGEQTFI